MSANEADRKTEDSGNEIASLTKPVKWKPSEYNRLKKSLPPNTGFSTYVKEAALEKLDRETAPRPKHRPIRLWGMIQAGEGTPVKPLPDDAIVHPPFEVGADCYALLVVGDSMESEYAQTIADGSFAVFCPQIAMHGNLVHVEWEDGCERMATFKKYVPRLDGSAEFHPLNKTRHKPIVRRAGEFHIRGVFMQAWKGE